MISEEEMINNFINKRKKHNETLLKNQQGYKFVSHWDGQSGWEKCEPFRLKETPLSVDRTDLLVINYKDGKGRMIVDMAKIDKIPKAKQNKLFNLGNI